MRTEHWGLGRISSQNQKFEAHPLVSAEVIGRHSSIVEPATKKADTSRKFESREENVFSVIEIYAICIVCFEYGIGSSDLKLDFVADKDMNHRIRSAKRMLCIIFENKMMFPKAQSKVVQIIGRSWVGEFRRYHTAACREYLTITKFRDEVNLVAQHIKDAFKL